MSFDGKLAQMVTSLPNLLFWPSISPFRCIIRSLFPCIWKWRGPERIRLLLWKAMHRKLMTNLERMRRHLSSYSTCPLCDQQSESLLHCFRDCQQAATLWMELLRRNNYEFFSNTSLFSWLANNITGKISGHTSLD